MNLLEIYKAKKLGCADPLFNMLLGKSLGTPHEWIIDKVPYHIRQSANGADIGSVCKDELVGGSVIWNQLIKNPGLSDVTNWKGTRASISASENVLTATADGTGFATVSGNMATSAPNHKHLIIFDINMSNVSKPFKVALSDQTINRNIAISSKKLDAANTWYTIGAISVPNSDEIKQARIGIEGLSNGDTIKVKNANVFDLDLMFGSTIADYLYSLETNTPGAGVSCFKSLFEKEFYAYRTTTLMSVNASAHIMRDSDNNIIGNYALDETLTLRGVVKLDANNKLYYDGDTYASDGTVTRKYGIRAYQEGDATDGSTMITDGTNTVYKLTTPTNETAETFTNPQSVSKDGTEEYIDYAVTKSIRDVSIPVGHNTEYKLFTE